MFLIMNFPFLDRDVPCSASYGVYISIFLFDLLKFLVMLMILILVIRF